MNRSTPGLCPSTTPGVHSNSCPSSRWCHPAISSSVIPFSSHLQSFPASGSFPTNLLRIRWPKYWSFSLASVLKMNIQGWSPSEWTRWISLQSKGLSRVGLLQHHSSNASILQCSAFLRVQLSHSYMTTGKIIALTRWTFVSEVMSLLFNMLSRLVILTPVFLHGESQGRGSLVGCHLWGRTESNTTEVT